jgi:hypothetical protein
MLVVSMVIDILPALSPINKQPYSKEVQGTDSQASGPIQNHDRDRFVLFSTQIDHSYTKKNSEKKTGTDKSTLHI